MLYNNIFKGDHFIVPSEKVCFHDIPFYKVL